jgi:hypothetical protein
MTHRALRLHLPLHWTDRYGRPNGEGEICCGRKNILGEEPPIGQMDHFSFCVVDAAGFVVAHCTNALVTMQSERSEASARLFAAAPELLRSLKELLEICRWKCSPNDEVLLANGKSNEQAMIEACEVIDKVEGREP